MTTRRRAATLLAALLCSLATALVGGLLAAPAAPTFQPTYDATSPADRFDADAPNVLLITTDDQTLADLAHMPKTRRLVGARGATFTEALSPHPLCCPARAEILTGQYAHHHRVWTNGGRFGGYGALRDRQNTLPVWLQRAGYNTAMVGKFMNKWRPRKHGTPQGFDDFRASPSDAFGYYDYRIWSSGTQANEHFDGTVYSSDYITDATVGLVEEWSSPWEGGRPFFIWSSYYAPHGDCADELRCKVPPTPARQYADALRGERAPALRKRSYDAHPDRPNPLVAGRPKVPAGKVQRLFLDRIRSLQSVDDGVERIIDALEAAGELDDTLVVFTSDNGYLIGEHRFIGKVVAYEESLRVPLLVRGPGIPEGVVRDQPVTTVDLAPTIAAAAGAEPTRRVDGRDVRRFARDGRARGADTVLVHAGNAPGKAERGAVMYRGVRTDRWTYTTWPQPGRDYAELFDRRRDRHQVDNLSGQRRYARDRKSVV